jgi:hypothetical protein
VKRLRAGALGVLVLAAVTLAEDPVSPWKPVFERHHLDPGQVQLAKSRWRGGGDHSLPFFERSWDDWTRIEPDSLEAARALLAAAPSFERLLAVTARLAAIETASLASVPSASAPAAVASDGRAALAETIAALESHLGVPLSPERLADLEARTRAVPQEVAARAAIVLGAVPGALDARKDALAGFRPEGVPEEKRIPLAYDKALAFGTSHDLDETTLLLLAAFDREAMLRGARLLARAVDAASAPLTTTSLGAFSFQWTTPIGEIALGGAGDQVYDSGPYLLVIDTAGDDTYRPKGAPAGRSMADYPIAISIDFAGDDLYEGDDLSFGVGLLGYGFLLDASGNDRYEASDVGPGSGILGVGISIDRSGNDRYKVSRFGEGAGVLGIGVLADLSGDDEYFCRQMAQGFGGPMGVGALVDVSGNDLYEADDTKIDFPSAQTKEHNVSLAQGCGFGRRAHPGDGHSIAGGLGILVDGAGNDHYKTGVFGQGVGYWYGMGVLVDLSGDDDYKGVWYAQGSAAHYAIGALIDLSGNDRYASLTQSQGQAHDGSIGLLVDGAGDDDYSSGGYTMGAGHIDSIGLFRDGGGNDRFTNSESSCGWAEERSPDGVCAGIFLKVGGAAHFATKPHGHDPALGLLELHESP